MTYYLRYKHPTSKKHIVQQIEPTTPVILETEAFTTSVAQAFPDFAVAALEGSEWSPTVARAFPTSDRAVPTTAQPHGAFTLPRAARASDLTIGALCWVQVADGGLVWVRAITIATLGILTTKGEFSPDARAVFLTKTDLFPPDGVCEIASSGSLWVSGRFVGRDITTAPQPLHRMLEQYDTDTRPLLVETQGTWKRIRLPEVPE